MRNFEVDLIPIGWSGICIFISSLIVSSSDDKISVSLWLGGWNQAQAAEFNGAFDSAEDTAIYFASDDTGHVLISSLQIEYEYYVSPAPSLDPTQSNPPSSAPTKSPTSKPTLDPDEDTSIGPESSNDRSTPVSYPTLDPTAQPTPTPTISMVSGIYRKRWVFVKGNVIQI